MASAVGGCQEHDAFRKEVFSLVRHLDSVDADFVEDRLSEDLGWLGFHDCGAMALGL